MCQAASSARIDWCRLLRFDRAARRRESIRVKIALAKDVEEFLLQQVRAGVCTDASELVNDVLRSVRETHQRPFEITPELEEWLLAVADKPVSPLIPQDFDAIRERVRARHSPGSA